MNKKSSVPRLHHTTARIYLKHFSTDGKTIYRYDKKFGELKSLPISLVGGVKDFYTTTDHEGKKDSSLENPFFSDIDGIYPSLVKKIKDRLPIISFQEGLATFMATQYARVEKQRGRWQRFFGEINLQQKNLGVLEKHQWIADGNTLNDAMLTEMSIAAGIMLNSHFGVFVAATSEFEFLTCDNPADRACLPLTPDACLTMPSQQPPTDYVMVNQIAINFINKMTFDKAGRYVYAKSKNTINDLLN